MPINKDDIYYQAGRAAFTEGKSLADKPGRYLTNDYEMGFMDALADAVRKHFKDK